MIDDTQLCQKIARELYNGRPAGAVKLVMVASLVISDEGDLGTFEFDYIDEKGIRTWFPLASNVDTSKIKGLLVQLRASYIESGYPVWNACEFVLDVQTGKFEIDVALNRGNSDDE